MFSGLIGPALTHSDTFEYFGMPSAKTFRQKKKTMKICVFKISRSFSLFSEVSKVFGHVRSCSDAFGRNQMRSDATGYIWVCLDAFGNFGIFRFTSDA